MKTTASPHSPQTLPRRATALAALLALAALTAHATPDQGSTCSACHTTPKNGMALVNFQTQTNLGAGLRKVFQVRPGQTAVLQFNVTNTYGGNYGITVNNLNGAGVNVSTDHLAYTPDATWTSRSLASYFTVGPIAGPQLWSFNLAVKTNTPADFYTVQTLMAGMDQSFVMWSQPESFYIQVLPPVAPTPTLLTPRRSSGSFSLQVATASGFTYYLEYKLTLLSPTWSVAAQAAGDGSVKTLTDAAATDSQRMYRVRVQ